MISKPLIPGQLYEVRGHGLYMRVQAANPVDALLVGIDTLIALEAES